jgi:hypothetical protein
LVMRINDIVRRVAAQANDEIRTPDQTRPQAKQAGVPQQTEIDSLKRERDAVQAAGSRVEEVKQALLTASKPTATAEDREKAQVKLTEALKALSAQEGDRKTDQSGRGASRAIAGLADLQKLDLTKPQDAGVLREAQNAVGTVQERLGDAGKRLDRQVERQTQRQADYNQAQRLVQRASTQGNGVDFFA